ncbi:MAG: prepilin-type N-terminal cleavage/methylation domain-containing protein [Spirochaetota bacterium]|nr:MAG: prepilin-type N-terminal cleavage/methylation domain-containing protein [Spirochaetota bacterium]
MKSFKGFTLIELLIAITIVSVIAAACVVSFTSINRVVDLHRRNDEMLRDLRGFLESADVEISSAFYVRDDKRTIFFSQRREIGDREVNNLMFTTVHPQHYLELGLRGEIINVQYIVESNEDNPGLLTLRKRILFNTFSNEVQTLSFESEYASLIENGAMAEYVIRDDFTLFQLRFYSEGKWHDSWDSRKQNQLPESIELIFSLGGKKYREMFNIFISET